MSKARKVTMCDPPLNMPKNGDIEALLAFDVGVTAIADSPLLGSFTLMTRDGHFDFLIDEEMANAIVQEVRAFLRGDSPSLLEAKT
jgi:translation initiation factor 6 (eIF-6)